jgi:hypothetical protein
MISQRQQLSVALIRVILEKSIIAKMLSVVLRKKEQLSLPAQAEAIIFLSVLPSVT